MVCWRLLTALLTTAILCLGVRLLNAINLDLNLLNITAEMPQKPQFLDR